MDNQDITDSWASYLSTIENEPFVPLGSLYANIFNDLAAAGLATLNNWGAYSITEKGGEALRKFRQKDIEGK